MVCRRFHWSQPRRGLYCMAGIRTLLSPARLVRADMHAFAGASEPNGYIQTRVPSERGSDGQDWLFLLDYEVWSGRSSVACRPNAACSLWSSQGETASWTNLLGKAGASLHRRPARPRYEVVLQCSTESNSRTVQLPCRATTSMSSTNCATLLLSA